MMQYVQYIERDIEKVIEKASKYYSVVIITGPRQVGKTTTLQRLSAGRTYVTLDHLEARMLAQRDPEMFLARHTPPVLIDEVQYAPQLFSYIKIAVDKGAPPGAFWLTGSQIFRLMDLAQESLAGRAAIFSMTSLSQHEIYGKNAHSPFEVDLEKIRKRTQSALQTDAAGMYQRIWDGSMPGLIGGKVPEREWFYASYLKTYVERDIGDMAGRANFLLFAEFIRAAACRIGQLLNLHDLASDIGVSDVTAKRWVQLMEKSGIIFFLRPYSNNLLKRTIKTPKMYFFDTGLVAYLTQHPSAKILMNSSINGAILENYVVAEILKSYSNAGRECYVYYYRDKELREIDLVMSGVGGQLHPFEVKKAASPGFRLNRKFRLLDAGAMPRGMGAIICLGAEFSAIDRETLIIPAWMI